MKKRKRTPAVTWVVYQAHHAGPHVGNAVCEQAEWDEMEQGWPGLNTLIRAGVANEAEAEALARSAPGGTAAKGATLKAR